MATLYELTEQMAQLLEMVTDPSVDEETINDTLEGIEGEIEEKADGYAKVMAELKGRVESLDKEISRLKARKESIENNIDKMKRSLESAMVVTGKTKFKTDLFSFAIQKNPPSVVIDNPEDIPSEYLIPQEPKVNTAVIKERLKAGEKFSFAHLAQGESLRIR